jgi:hypothetical protein
MTFIADMMAHPFAYDLNRDAQADASGQEQQPD